MSSLGRTVLLWMIPVNLLLIAWVWFGRFLFGVAGWFLLIYLLTVVPVLLMGLLISTILAYSQPGRPRALTGPQAAAQLTVWGGMFAVGLLTPDYGDTPESAKSVLTQVFGYSDGLYDLSYLLTSIAAVLTVAAWMVLVVTLTAGRRSHDLVTQRS